MVLIIYLSFLIRILLATYHSDVSYLPGASDDAIRYHLEALEFYEELFLDIDLLNYNFEIGWIYSSFLGFIYFIFSPSFLLANYLSCFVWLISAHVLIKIIKKLNYSQNTSLIIIIIYSFFFPTSILYTSITLREVYVLLFFNLFALTIINFLIEKKILYKIYNFFWIIIWSFLLGIFHKSSIIFIILFSVLILFYLIIKKFNFKFFHIISFLILCISILHYTEILEVGFKKIISYQMGHYNTFDFFRAEYFTKDQIESRTYSPLNFLVMLFENLFNYLAQPSIFRITNIPDFVLFYENTFRIFLWFFMLLNFFKNPKNKIIFNIFLIIVITMELVYSQATVNWGTASRHHLPVFGILLLAAFFPLRKKNKN